MTNTSIAKKELAKVAQAVLDKNPDYTNTLIALELTGGYRNPLYSVVALMLNDIKLRRATKTNTNVTGTLRAIKRLNGSTLGNPNFSVTIATDASDLTTYRTKSNASVGYTVTNFKLGTTVELSLTPSNRIVDMKEAK